MNTTLHWSRTLALLNACDAGKYFASQYSTLAEAWDYATTDYRRWLFWALCPEGARAHDYRMSATRGNYWREYGDIYAKFVEGRDGDREEGYYDPKLTDALRDRYAAMERAEMDTAKQQVIEAFDAYALTKQKALQAFAPTTFLSSCPGDTL